MKLHKLDIHVVNYLEDRSIDERENILSKAVFRVIQKREKSTFTFLNKMKKNLAIFDANIWFQWEIKRKKNLPVFPLFRLWLCRICPVWAVTFQTKILKYNGVHETGRISQCFLGFTRI